MVCAICQILIGTVLVVLVPVALVLGLLGMTQPLSVWKVLLFFVGAYSIREGWNDYRAIRAARAAPSGSAD